MITPPRAANADDLVALLGARARGPDDAALERARAACDLRPIPYALGSGEADQVALFAGLKPVLRQILPAAREPAVRDRFESLGLSVEVTAHVTSEAAPEEAAAGRVLFVGRDPARVRAARALEEASDHDDDELGRLLGYPRCCIAAYRVVPPPRSNAQVFVAAARRTSPGSGPLHPRLNVLDPSIFHYVSWLPCSFSCAPSRAYADAVARHIAFSHGQFVGTSRSVNTSRMVCPPGCQHQRFVAAIDHALAAHRLLAFEDVQLSLRGRFEGSTLLVDEAWPTARDRHPDVPLRPAAREATARLLRLVEQEPRVAVREGALLIGGEPIAALDDALLLPFGPTA